MFIESDDKFLVISYIDILGLVKEPWNENALNVLIMFVEDSDVWFLKDTKKFIIVAFSLSGLKLFHRIIVSFDMQNLINIFEFTSLNVCNAINMDESITILFTMDQVITLLELASLNVCDAIYMNEYFVIVSIRLTIGTWIATAPTPRIVLSHAMVIKEFVEGLTVLINIILHLIAMIVDLTFTPLVTSVYVRLGLFVPVHRGDEGVAFSVALIFPLHPCIVLYFIPHHSTSTDATHFTRVKVDWNVRNTIAF
jgi:hypothetical protein